MSPAAARERNARVGAKIRRRRQALGWEQRDLAEQVGVHISSVQKWEAGTYYPGRKLGKLEAVLGIDLTDEPEPEPVIPRSLMDAIRRSDLSPAEQEAVIGAVEQTLRDDQEHAASDRSTSRRAG